MHEIHEVNRKNKKTKQLEEVLREDSDMVSFKGLRSYLVQGAKNVAQYAVKKLSGNDEETIYDKLQGCSILFETLENEKYFLAVTVHERLHGEEFIVQGNLYEKTNAHFGTDNCIAAPRRTFVGENSRTNANVFANNFINEISAKYDLE
jgi:hypothetical protein